MNVHVHIVKKANIKASNNVKITNFDVKMLKKISKVAVMHFNRITR